MKAILGTTQEGKQCWVVTHNLTLIDSRKSNFRPIHALTLLAQFKVEQKKGGVFILGLSLENKLFAVQHHLRDLQRSIASVGDFIYPQEFIRDYGKQQNVVSDLEALLNSIYASLEITSQINRYFHPGLPVGFRRQAKKFDLFSFEKWEWLPHFYDIRSELTHFGSPLPIVSEGKFIIEFTQTKRLYKFKKQKYEMLFTNLTGYAQDLFKMLDSWAIEELKDIDPNQQFDSAYIEDIYKPVKFKKEKIEVILKLLPKQK